MSSRIVITGGSGFLGQHLGIASEADDWELFAPPSTMINVRNPTGTSHSPSESAPLDDCLTGVRALATVIEDLACR